MNKIHFVIIQSVQKLFNRLVHKRSNKFFPPSFGQIAFRNVGSFKRDSFKLAQSKQIQFEFENLKYRLGNDRKLCTFAEIFWPQNPVYKLFSLRIYTHHSYYQRNAISLEEYPRCLLKGIFDMALGVTKTTL